MRVRVRGRCDIDLPGIRAATTAAGDFAHGVLDDGMYAAEIRFGQTGYFGALRFGTILFDY